MAGGEGDRPPLKELGGGTEVLLSSIFKKCLANLLCKNE